MDVARAFHRAVNDANLDALIALYDPHCIAEHVWIDSHDVVEGRDHVRERWEADFAQFRGALAGGHRMDVTRVAGIETGWGWVRSEWVQSVTAGNGASRDSVGYSHFWIEDGLIRRHRTIAKEVDRSVVAAVRAPSERRYPTRPLVGIGAVVFSDAGEVLIVKRRHEPLAGQWSLPGGMLELGETLEAGVVREIEEETGLIVTVGDVVEAFDRILLDDDGKVRYHFVLIDYVCRVRGGTLRAGSDVAEALFVRPDALGPYRLTGKAADVIERAMRITIPLQ